VERRRSADAPLYTTGGKPSNWQLLLQIWRFSAPSRSEKRRSDSPRHRLA